MRKFLCLIILFLLAAGLITAQTVSFTLGALAGESLVSPTSLQFGPDGRLYVAQQNGLILAYTIVRNGPNNYQVTATEAITLIQQIPNHNDDGTLAPAVNTRQVTGIKVAGTAANPVIFVTSSDPRIGGGSGSTNKNLDTNSGVISKLTKTNGTWLKQDLVRGLPRSEENHSPNGLEYDPVNNYLYMAQGGNTNMGAPSNNFVYLPEYAYSTAILRINLSAIGSTTYDLPTLDDETRANVSGKPAGYVDPNDPFGGNDGKNQAILVANGPVQIYSPGWRNNYDVIIAQNGKMYSFDNGPNSGWGGPPSNCSNSVSEPGSAACDVLHYVTAGYYAGHPNPTRANRNNKFNTSNPQTPVPLGMENPIECSYATPASRPGAIAGNCSSSNGLCEYTASNFSNAMKGNLLVASFNGKIYRIKLNATGTGLATGGMTVLASNFGTTPLDITAQDDNSIFPGTIWICTYGSNDIAVLEPNDFVSCSGDMNSFIFDFDADGYSNGDETANQTDPCSAASKPHDYDRDNLSDLTDPDDDNDGISDMYDWFPVDPLNGYSTKMPVKYEFDNSDDGGLLGWGFTGLMTNGGIDYSQLFDADKMTVGGAALKFTVEQVPAGDALNNFNNQMYGFQFGVNAGASQWQYIIHSRVMGPFAGFIPVNNQSMGMFMGTGDQNNYLKIVTAANGGAGGIQVLKEENGVSAATMYNVSILNKSYVDLYFYVNKNTNQVQPKYSIEGGAQVSIGPPVSVPANWLSGILAVGFISTSRGSNQLFPATWDFIEVKYDPETVLGQWYQVASKNSPIARHECSYVQAGNKFYLVGGRGSKPVQSYNPQDSLWTTEASNPLELHHFQAVQYNGLIYVVCAFTGSFPHETPVSNIYIYDPVAKQWSAGPSIPAGRRRGAAGCVVYNNKIYVVCGIVDGHYSGWVPWLDVFDPQTNTWTQLPDAPRARDHFNAIVASGKIYCIGGRRSGYNGSTFSYTTPEVDVYDIAANAWTTLPPALNIPTPRAACATALLNDEILVIGGESGTQTTAHNQTEAFNYVNKSWRVLAPLIQGRHATTAIVSNGGVFMVCGSGNRGGSPELGTQEVFYFFDPAPPTGTEIVKGNLAPDAVKKYFGMVKPPDTFTKTLTVKNTGGNQVIMIDTIILSDAINFKLDFPHSFPFLLGVNQAAVVNLTFQPASMGIKDAGLQIRHNGTNTPLHIALRGEGTSLSCTTNCISKIYFPDADGDQYGYPLDSVISALAPTGYVLNNNDCDDANASISPAAAEALDNVDNNCNGAVDEGFGPPNVLFVVGNMILSTSDAAIKARMDALGFEVTTVADAAVQTSDAVGQDLIFLSATVTSGNIGTKFTSTPVPLINCEPAIMDDLKMTSASVSDFGSLTNQTQLSIVNPAHPLAGGLPAGTITVFTSADRLVFGVPSAGAAKIATVAGSATQAVVFGYEAGASMAGLNAPARRVGFFLYDTGPAKLNANGAALLDAALLWAANSTTPPPPPTPPHVAITSPSDGSSFTAPVNVTVSVNATSPSGTITKVELYQNNSLAGTINTSPYSFSITNLPAGSYSFYAKAYDNHGLTTNSAAVAVSVQPAPAGSAQALLVVGSTALNSGDLAIKTRMEFLGYTVTVKGAASSVSADAAGKNVVFISSTVNSGDVNSKFKDVAVPVIVCENALLDDMKMTGALSGNYGAAKTMNKITITNNAHPLAAGLPSGEVAVYASSDNLTWGQPANSAIIIASVAGVPSQITIFAYESGAAMAGMNAPARRIGFFLHDFSASLLTADGAKLLDAALLWAAPLNTAADCQGVPNGTAYLNSCGICVGGTTGLNANAGKDCNGVCNGTASFDDCGVCSGGNTGHVANSDKDACGVCFGNGSSCAPPLCVQNEVVSFTLVRAGTAGEIGPLTNGMTINLAAIGSFSIRANVCSTPVGSVKFILNGKTVKTESTPPYAINGDSPVGNYTAWTVAAGSYTLTATPFTGSGGTGTAGVSETVSFTVVSQSAGTTDCNGVAGGTAFIDNCGVCSGGNTGHVANSDKDACGVCFGDGSSCCQPLQVVSFTLVREGTAGDIGPLTQGMSINLASIGNFSVRANVCPGSTSVKSVKFELNGVAVKTENTAPYAVNGDSPAGNYIKWNISPGSYALKATPYSGTGGSGMAGIALAVNFTVVSGASKTDVQDSLPGAEEAHFSIYPNPSNGHFVIELEAGQRCNVVLRIFNHLGQMIYSEVKKDFIGELKEHIQLDHRPSGMYFLRAAIGDKIFDEKIMVRY